MSRLDRKKRPYEELGIKGHGGLTDLFDMMIQETFYIDSKEYDYICEHMPDEEMDILFTIDTSMQDKEVRFSDIRKALNVVDKYVKDFRDGKV